MARSKDDERQLNLYEYDVRLSPDVSFKRNIADELRIDIENLNKHLTEQPTRYVWWAALHSRAKALADDLKRQLELREAELMDKFREHLTGPDNKKPTEKACESAVMQSKEYQDLYRRMLEAKQQENLLYSAREAMAQRKDVLVALAMNVRREWDVDPGRRVDRMSALEGEYERRRTEVGRDDRRDRDRDDRSSERRRSR